MSPTTQPRFCRDCVHIRDAQHETFEKCGASIDVDLVSGKQTFNYCTTMRLPSMGCGREAILFVAREEVTA